MQKKACDACHKRKIQCDSSTTESQCNWCHYHNVTCTFNRVRGRRKLKNSRLKPSSEKNISDRLERIELALARTIARKDELKGDDTPTSTSISNTSSPRSSTNLPPATARPTTSLGSHFAAFEPERHLYAASPGAGNTSQIHYAGCHLGQISCSTGIPLFSEDGQRWVATRTGETTAFRHLRAMTTRQRALAPTLSANQYAGSAADLYELPDRALVERCSAWFQKCAFRLVFPAIDHVLFEDTIALAYDVNDGPPPLERISAKACILSFISIMCLFQGESPLPIDIDCDACALKAHHLLSDVLEDGSLVSLQTVIMLYMHQTFSGRLQCASMFHAISCRLAFMLGGHTNYAVKPYGADVTYREREGRHLRTLFWLCYIVDKDIALRTGQPPIVTDDFCDLTLPEGYLEHRFDIPALTENLVSPLFADESLVPYLPGDLRLCQLKDKTCRLLYSASSLRKSDAELLRDIRELDEELEKWRLSVPPDFRPALSVSQNTRLQTHMWLPQSMQRIVLYLEYHHMMTTIHRASGRCLVIDPETGLEQAQKNSGVHSSIALSLEASRSTIFYLRAAVHGLASEAFWIIVYYPTAAIMTLFFNILINPLDPQSKQDMELLSSAVELIRSMPVRKLTAYEIGHIKMVDDFVAEMLRLGNCAIAKETRERAQKERDGRLMNGDSMII